MTFINIRVWLQSLKFCIEFNRLALFIFRKMATQNKTKKLINSAENSAWEGLNGLVCWNPGLALMPGHKDVVIRRDWEEVKKAGKVSMITGGGSGHEPMWAG